MECGGVGCMNINMALHFQKGPNEFYFAAGCNFSGFK